MLLCIRNFVFLTIIFLIPLQSCTQMSDKKVTRFLEERYALPFTVLDSKFIADIGITRYSVICDAYPKIPFSVEYRPGNDSFLSYFEHNLWTYQSRLYFGKRLKQHYSKYALSASVEVGADIDPKNIPSFESLLEMNPEEIYTNIKVHLFKDLSEQTADSLLTPIINITNELIQKPMKQSSFTISFYDEAYFNGKELTNYHFGFNTIDEADFEMKERDKFRYQIKYRTYNSSAPVSVDQLFQLRSNNPNLLMFNDIE